MTFANVAHAADFRVTFLNPGGETGFWGDVSRTMAAAAADLDVDLEILHAERQPYIMEALLRKRLDDGDLPDYFVLVNESQSAGRLLQLMDGMPSKVFFLLNKLTPQQKANLEEHNIDLGNIVGSISPDNETAGYEMAQSLIDAARMVRQDGGPLNLLALTGDVSTPAGVQREMGMLRAVADNDDVKLLHAIPADWNETVAYRRASEVFARMPVDMVWAANDDIAFGARKAALEAGLTPGKDIFFAGLNWSERGMEAVHEGEMTMTHGGHFFAGAWSMVMLHDHFFRDFEGDVFVDVLFKMSPVTQQNVDLYLSALGDGNWDKIDFSLFSKTINNRSHYDFSAAAILDAARN
ncbi:ABC transporter substrate-binding protein [Labrenzia sp. 011]|uniref:ABC transporter substrate-binding protein n=1 Tax=Labrenzia sp. 011 TaxID=2171494 RepID=UPI001AD92D34|nr:ABC transporter substrate-binding protein [Labrenzia sp. 011]